MGGRAEGVEVGGELAQGLEDLGVLLEFEGGVGV